MNASGSVRTRRSGFALVEALVALLVTAFALLGLTKLQAAQRSAAEHARHLGEALTLARGELEQARADAAAGIAVGRVGSTTVEGLSNTQFSVGLASPPSAAPAPAVSDFVVRVDWADRHGAAQRLELRTLLASAPPGLIGTRLSGTQAARAGIGISTRVGLPANAVDLGNGSHRFAPPGGDGTTWRLDSTTGEIEETCDAQDRCEPCPALLVQGHVRFAPGAVAPGPAQSESPPGPSLPLEVRLVVSQPREAVVDCIESRGPSHVVFHCAVPLPAGSSRAWLGRIELEGLRWATSIDDPDSAAWRVCRYGPEPARSPAPASDEPNASDRTASTGVSGSLMNRNFLVIRAGDGTRAFDCPGDDPETPWLDGRTWHHQPDR